MPILLFRLNAVPDDEADDVRALLTDHRIDFYETDAGRWGVSVAAIWLRDGSQLERARALIDRYQHERSSRIRSDYEVLRRAGAHETMVHRLRRRPLAFLLYALALLAVLYLSVMPFVIWH